MQQPETKTPLPAEPSREIQDAARAFVLPLREALGPEFIAAYLTGSVLGHDFDVRHSRVNIVLIARELNAGVLDRAREAMPDSKRARFDLLLLTRGQIEDSLDSFAIEMLEMRERHFTLEGEDVLARLEVPRDLLRLQCEHELRAKHIQLRQAWLHSARHGEALQDVLRGAASSFATLFRTLLRLRGESVPAGKTDVVRRVAEAFGLDAAGLLAAHEVRTSGRRYKATEIVPIYRAFLTEISGLVVAIDQLRVS